MLEKQKVIVIDENTGDKLDSVWNNFIDNHPFGTIFQTPGYFNLFKGNSKFKPVAFLVFSEANELKGVLSGIIQYHLPSPLRKYSGRCVVMGGPVVVENDSVLAGLLLKEFDTYMDRNVLYSQFRNIFETSSIRDVFGAYKFEYEDHLDIIVDLAKSEEELFKELHSTKRNEVRRSMKNRLDLKVINDHNELKKSYNILRSVYSRIKLPLFPFEIFSNAFFKLAPEGKAIFFGSYLDNRLIGTMYTFCYKGVLYDFFSGSDPAEYKFFPNSFLPWKIFLWGKKNNIVFFDWGGAGKPGIPYGVRDYKEKFGGKLVCFGRYEKIHSPLFLSFAKSFFAFWQFLRVLKSKTGD